MATVTTPAPIYSEYELLKKGISGGGVGDKKETTKPKKKTTKPKTKKKSLPKAAVDNQRKLPWH